MPPAPKRPRLPRRPRIRISRQRRGSARWRGWLAGAAGLSLLLGAGLWSGDQLRQQPRSVDLEHSLEVLRADLQREEEHVALGATARLAGNLYCAVLKMAEGAQVDGLVKRVEHPLQGELEGANDPQMLSRPTEDGHS